MNKKQLVNMVIAFIATGLFGNTIKIDNLESLIDFAIHNNQMLMLEKQQASITLEKVKKDIGSYFPAVNLSFSDSALVNFNLNDYRNKNFSFGLSWLAYDGGERKLEYKLKVLEAGYSRILIEESITNHCIEIMETYYEFQKALRKKEILLKTLENAMQWKKSLKKEFDFGMILETDVLEFEVKSLEIENQILIQNDELNKILYSLKLMIGLNADDEILIPLDETLLSLQENSLDNYKNKIPFAILNNTNHRKMQMEIEHEKNLMELKKSFYLPRISMEPGVTFDGEDYPLRGPKYQLKFSFSFEKNPFLSFNGSHSLGFAKNVLTESTSYNQTASKNDFSWKEEKKLKEIGLKNQLLQLKEEEEKFRMNIYKMIMEHNQLLKSIQIITKEIEINQKLSNVLLLEIKNGIKCPLDYLEQQILSAEKEILLYEAYMKAALLERKLEYSIYRNNRVFYDDSKK